jgi:hypothetical protein
MIRRTKASTMKKLGCVLLAALFLNGIVNETIFAQGSEKKSKNKTIKLFNGKDLDGWYTFLQHRGRDNDPKKVFTVHEGMIRISGEEWGCITTQAEYEDYKIHLEFKWGGQTHAPRLNNTRDSGLLLHSQGKDGGSEGIWMHSIECQIIEGGTGDFIVVGDGSDYFQITSTVAADKQEGSFVYEPKGREQTINQGRLNWFARDPEWKDVIGLRGKKDVEKTVEEQNTLEYLVVYGYL